MPRSLAPLLTALLALVVPAQAAPTQPAAADARFEALGARFIAEFGREPDDFLGLLTFGMSMGQWLSLPMILAGIAMAAWAVKRQD